MSTALRTILEGQWAHRVVDDRIIPYVFHNKGRQIKGHQKAWAKAREAAGLPDKLLHDCRRTVARNIIFAGNPEQVAMQVTGHTSRSVFDRYVIVPPEPTKAALDQTAEFVQRQQAAPVRRIK